MRKIEMNELAVIDWWELKKRTSLHLDIGSLDVGRLLKGD